MNKVSTANEILQVAYVGRREIALNTDIELTDIGCRVTELKEDDSFIIKFGILNSDVFLTVQKVGDIHKTCMFIQVEDSPVQQGNMIEKTSLEMSIRGVFIELAKKFIKDKNHMIPESKIEKEK